jgi:isopenicillin N synthase-like dioxygenase
MVRCGLPYIKAEPDVRPDSSVYRPAMTTGGRQAAPVIDLENSSGDLAAALEESSCVLVTGHGVPPAVTAQLLAASRTFFELPRAAKAAVEWPGDLPWKGWQPVSDWPTELSGRAAPDHLERFEARLPMPRADGSDLAAWAEAFPLWPVTPAAFATAWTGYYAEMVKLGSRVIEALAISYDLPDDDVAGWTERQFSNLVVNRYPPQPEPPAEGIRQHSHTDIGGLTVLWADDAPGGLEVMFPGGRDWTPVTIPPNCFLLQAGDLLARWTNHRIKANVHRVGNPPAALGPTAERYSVAFFQYPELDAEVVPATSCLRPGQRPPRPMYARSRVVRRQRGYRPGEPTG